MRCTAITQPTAPVMVGIPVVRSGKSPSNSRSLGQSNSARMDATGLVDLGAIHGHSGVQSIAGFPPRCEAEEWSRCRRPRLRCAPVAALLRPLKVTLSCEHDGDKSVQRQRRQVHVLMGKSIAEYGLSQLVVAYGRLNVVGLQAQCRSCTRGARQRV